MHRGNGIALAACGLLALAGCGGDEDRDRVISGTISGAVVERVILTLVTPDPALRYVQLSDEGGRYAFTRLADGRYEVIPSLPGCAFEPGSAPVTIAGGDVGGIDFTSTARPATGAAPEPGAAARPR